MVQGSLGLGFALVSGPALVAVDPGFAPGPLIVVGQIVGLRHTVAERRHTDRRAVRHCVYGLPLGLAAGLAVLLAISEDVLAFLIGGVTAVAAISLLCGIRVRRSTPVEIATGAGATFTSVTAGLPGPPLVLTFSDMKPATMRGTVGTFFLLVAITAAIALVVADEFGGREVGLTGWLIPGVLIGLVASRYVRPLLDRAWFRPAVLIVAFAGGIALILRQLL